MTHPQPAPVIVLTGDEPLLQQEWLAHLRAQLAVGPFDEHAFRGAEADITDVLAAALAAPLEATRRCVLWQDAHLITAGTLAHLVTYARAPQPSTCLVLVLPGSPPKSAPWPELLALASVVACDAPQGSALRQWITQRAAALDTTVSPAAASLLEEQWGHDLLALANALDQAACYVGARRTIEEGDVEALGGRHPQATVFQWSDLIVRRDLPAALRFLDVQWQEGKTAPQLIGMLTWQFERLLRAKRLAQAGAPEGQIAASVGITQPRWRGEFLRQLVGYALPQLQAAMAALLGTDIAIKRGQGTPELLVELLVVRLCGGTPSEPTLLRRTGA